MGSTLVEKVATLHAQGLAPGQVARSGDFVTIAPRRVMTHDNTGAVMPKFQQLFEGIAPPKIRDPQQLVFAIDHDIQNKTPANLGKYAKIEAFAHQHGVDFYPPGTGIGHQVMVEEGYVVPGSMVVASDSHSNLYGALACLGTPVVRTDAASIWATGVTWWQVPPVARVTLRGKLRPGVAGKDVIIALCGLFHHDEVLNHAVEFAGDGVECLSIEERMSISNMTTEWGALAGIFPFDAKLRDWLVAAAPRHRRYSGEEIERLYAERARFAADADAGYAVELELDLATVVPAVAGPNDVKTIVPLPEIESKRVAIQKAWLMSCVNARLEDLHAAAEVVRGKQVAPGVELYLAAASASIERAAKANGDWKALVDAGAIELPPGCGTCIGLGAGTIKAGEVGVSATNRNFEGRMGDRAGLVYLASPAVVAASAIAGYICAPQRFEAGTPRTSIRRSKPAAAPASGVAMVDGFPPRLAGRVLWMDRDNLNTDGIYAGKHTYNDAMTPAEMAAVIFENHDPGLRGWAKPGDIVVSGLNFGTGSSREQAATALKAFGIPCVIAASFSETYKRNAFNNGFVCFECPGLVEHLRRSKPRGQGGPATQLAGDLAIDFKAGLLTLDLEGARSEFRFVPLSPTAQELVVAGGAEAVVRRRLAAAAR